MVFANLQAQEKDAFFSLLDEYFAARPEIFANAGDSADTSQSNTSAQGAAFSAAHRAMASNPEATAKLFSAGLKHGIPKSSPYSAAASDPEVNNAAGRVAAASLAFSASRNKASSSNSPPPVAEKPSTVSSLKSVRKFGSDVDTSSAKNLFGSLRNSTGNKNSPPPAPFIPPAFPHKQNSFEPPPSRRMAASSVSSDPPPPPPPPPPGRQYQEEEEEEEEEQGEWAEALYDYDSTEPGDLSIKENQRILITERTSDDWWTGEVNGKKGLFPASYVKLS